MIFRAGAKPKGITFPSRCLRSDDQLNGYSHCEQSYCGCATSSSTTFVVCHRCSPFEVYAPKNSLWDIPKGVLAIQPMPRTAFSASYETLIERLVEARMVAGLKQTELAARLAKPQSFVSKVEKGERRRNVVELLIYSRAMVQKTASVNEIAIQVGTSPQLVEYRIKQLGLWRDYKGKGVELS